jgi:hypothetical protein
VRAQQPLKVWLAYEGIPEWYIASFVCENGAVPYTHCSSHPRFVAGDLWTDRPERQKQMAEAGFEVQLQNGGEPVSIKKLPKEVLKANKTNKEEIKAFYRLVFLGEAE